MKKTEELKSLSDDELLRRLSDVLKQSRRVESELVAHIAEVDERRLYAREASPSMFQYCIDVLHLSKPEAYLRIGVARASRKHPMLLTMLADGRLHLSGIVELAPQLTDENRDDLSSSDPQDEGCDQGTGGRDCAEAGCSDRDPQAAPPKLEEQRREARATTEELVRKSSVQTESLLVLRQILQLRHRPTSPQWWNP